MTCMPTGSPSVSKPTGMDSAGRPARLGTPVNCMMADSMSSRWPFSMTTSVAPHGVAVKGSEAIIDPFNGGAVLDRERINTPGFGAPLLVPEPGSADQPDPFTPVSDIEVLLRLQNNIKNRALKDRNTARAIEILRRMTLIAPRRSIVWLELGRLQESAGALSYARGAYETCLKLPRSSDQVSNEATFALQALKRRLN